MSFNETHPELYDGEIFLGNFKTKDFFQCGWKTKRMGKIAYCKDGKPLGAASGASGYYPVFVQKKELDNAGVKLSNPLRSLTDTL